MPYSATRAAAIFLLLAVPVSDAGADAIDFNRDVRPILSDHCFQCHGPDSASREAGLRLDRESSATADLGGYSAIVPGDPSTSELMVRIASQDPDLRMPPEETKKPLSKKQIELLRRWVSSGAEYAEHWAFEAPELPEVPSVKDDGWITNEIDRFVLARLEASGLQPSPPAPRIAWLRRVTLDLTGLPPTLDEIERFVADRSPDAFHRVVDRLLQSERYGEAMALDWLDAARYADTDGYQNDGPREMWPWRDWVIDAYNTNIPFDQFTIEQLAGDLLPGATLQQRIATGFNRNHRYNSEAGLVLEEFLLENAVDRVDTTSTVWMGLTVGCARCHDHKFDPISQREYYQLIGFFDNVAESGRAVKFGNSEPCVQAPTRAQRARLAVLDRNIRMLRDKWTEAGADIDAAIDAAGAGLLRAEPTRLTLPAQRHAFAFDGEIAFDGETSAPSQENDQHKPEMVDGIIGGAVEFTGDEQLPLGKVADARVQERFSFSFWIKPKRSPSGDVLDGVILSRQAGDTRRPGISVQLADQKLQFFLITRWVAGVGAIATTRSIEADQWTHVVISNDGTQSARGMRIFVNGQRADTRILYNTNSNTGGTSKNAILRVGGGVHGQNYHGSIDELRYFDRTLWPDEVELLHQEPSLRHAVSLSSADRNRQQSQLVRHWFANSKDESDFHQLASQLHHARMERLKFRDSLPTTMIMRERASPRVTHVRRRGVYHQLGEQVEPGTPEIFPPLPNTPRADRLAFARWLVSGTHPLTARVTVNRYWQRYFGRGLVDTPGDFGLQGSSPSHPDLLDWLATEFVRSDWDIKHMQRLIVLSSTYRQSSEVTEQKLEQDPENRWFARGPRLRLPAHVVRDQALFVSGLLSNRQGGPSVKTFQPKGLWAEMSNMRYTLSEGADLYRRSLYTFWKRTVAPPSLAVLDAADRETCAVRSRRTNTPLQALTLLNETAFVQAAFGLAYQLMTEDKLHADASAERLVENGFRRVAARRPSERELRVLVDALNDYRGYYESHPRSARELIAAANVPIPLQDIEQPIDLAATTALANVLLNLDEVISKE